MEVDEEVENKKLDERRKRLQKQLREMDKLLDLDEMLRDGHKAKWKKELQEIQTKREHQKTQRSHKLQSLQDKIRNYL